MKIPALCLLLLLTSCTHMSTRVAVAPPPRITAPDLYLYTAPVTVTPAKPTELEKWKAEKQSETEWQCFPGRAMSRPCAHRQGKI